MGALIVGLIGIVFVIAAVVIPIWLEKNARPGIPLISAPAPLPVMVILGIFTGVGLLMAAQVADPRSENTAAAVALFLALAAIASAFFARSAVSRNLSFGSYLGFITAAFAAMLMLWTAVGGDQEFIRGLGNFGSFAFVCALLVSLIAP